MYQAFAIIGCVTSAVALFMNGIATGRGKDCRLYVVATGVTILCSLAILVLR